MSKQPSHNGARLCIRGILKLKPILPAETKDNLACCIGLETIMLNESGRVPVHGLNHQPFFLLFLFSLP